MKLIEMVKSGFKRLYTGENILLKHIGLLCLAGIPTVVILHIQIFAEQAKNTAVAPDYSTIMLGFLCCSIIFFYMLGYGLNFAHNSFDDNNGDILPELDFVHFGRAFHFLKLLLVLVLWIILTSVIGIIPVLGWIYAFVWFIGVSFICVAYAKSFKREGLYKYSLPFAFAKHAWLDFIILNIVYYMVAGILLYLIGCILSFIPVDESILDYVTDLLSAYVATILGFVYYYCLVQIYREKIEQNIH